MSHPNCKCSLRTRLAGDGCQWCNPTLAAELVLEQLDELRAYKERTEAALREFTSELSNYGGVPTNYYREELRRLGLWREGGAAGTAQE